jgi:NTP pyrophosphatase (non-canonical NTP hydrolase)
MAKTIEELTAELDEARVDNIALRQRNDREHFLRVQAERAANGYTEDELKVLSECLDVFGREHNLRKTSEECHELGAAACHHIDGKVGVEALIEEAADLLICIEIIRIQYPQSLRDAVQRKIARVRDRVASKKSEG